jgi:hypothetical protein
MSRIILKYETHLYEYFNFRTIGEIVEEDIGIEGVHLGLNKSLLENCTSHSSRSKRWVMTQSALPSFMKSRVNDKPLHFVKVAFKIRIFLSVIPV